MTVPRPPAPLLIRPVKLPASTPPPLTGPWSPADTRLDDVETLPVPRGHGPEDVAVGPDGHVYSGTEDGRIWRWKPDAHARDEPVPVAEPGGRPLGIEIDARDGVVYFTDSSNRFPVSHWRRDLLEHRPNGRVLAYDPASGRTDVVAEGFHFPNGVALTPDEDALLLCETVAHRLLRLSLPDGAVPVLHGDLAA